MKMNTNQYFALALIISFIITVFITKRLIPFLKKLKMGQKILDIGPMWHKPKEGTPTMGGISFLIATVFTETVLIILLAFTSDFDVSSLVITSVFCVTNALVGLFDDMTKIRKRQNEGLTPIQKIILQSVIAVGYLSIMHIHGNLSTQLYIPFFDVNVNLGIFYYVFALILILGVVNCANLTDGIDGLAASVALIINFFFAAAAVCSQNSSSVILSACICGGCIGFLVYNIHPAKIFMGDTGSLFLGAAAVGTAFMMNNPLIVLLCGIVYVVEGASVIIQVAVYKAFHRRVFRMAPIHHHFEKCGMKENGIVMLFCAITFIFCIISIFALV
ncbi:MAG: phospho-N-acetylmuramoyl-pentapeptide-transferase [Eubacteriales bacterium]|nr:phospho-N-acetylmuramoyl-pentapeptide-transferase [Eubacteriales bacterium]